MWVVQAKHLEEQLTKANQKMQELCRTVTDRENRIKVGEAASIHGCIRAAVSSGSDSHVMCAMAE